MKKTNFTFLTALLLLVLATACDTKDAPDPQATQTPAKQSDQAGSTEIDEALNNVNDLINNKIGNGSNYRIARH